MAYTNTLEKKNMHQICCEELGVRSGAEALQRAMIPDAQNAELLSAYRRMIMTVRNQEIPRETKSSGDGGFLSWVSGA